LGLLAAAALLAGAAQGADKSDRIADYERHLTKVRDLLGLACTKAGLPISKLGYSPRDLSLMRDSFRLTRFDAFIRDPIFFKVNCDTFGHGLRVGNPAAVFGLLARLNDVAFWRSAGKKEAAPGNPGAFCLDAFSRLWKSVGKELGESEKEALQERLKSMPPSLLRALGRYVGSVAKAVENFRAAFDAASVDAVRPLLSTGRSDWFSDGLFQQKMYDFSRRLDMTTVLYASKLAMDAAVRFSASLRKVPWTDESAVPPCSFDTPLGKVVFGGPKADKYPAGRYFLIVDFGGDDTYGAGVGGADMGQYVSLAIDLAGADRYEAPKGAAPSFGAGYLGVGMLFDGAGDDVYTAHENAFGAAEFGAGFLLDEKGNDRYTIFAGGQGCARFGVAALIDYAGNDNYTCFQLSQGVGLTRGVGALVDREGNDIYLARDDKIVFPSAQSKKHNSSLAQGCGFGRRADMTDGHSVSGGVGLLIDGAGDDTYSAGVMAQAHGYWYGTGVLIDYGGDDEYRAAWYGQSTSAHFGLSYFRDVEGNDRYETLISQNLGNGRDLSLSFFEDDQGDDIYKVVDRGGGCGNINGVGIFLDLAGEDYYTIASKVSMGIANLEAYTSMIRREIHTVGLFVDGGGRDTYSFLSDKVRRQGIENSAFWVQTNTRFEISMGIDVKGSGQGGAMVLPPQDYARFAFHSGGVHHPEGFGEWKYAFCPGGAFHARHDVQGKNAYNRNFPLTDPERKRLRALLNELNLPRLASSTRPGVPDEVMYTLIMSVGKKEYRVLVWVRDARKNERIVRLVDFFVEMTKKYAGLTPVIK